MWDGKTYLWQHEGFIRDTPELLELESIVEGDRVEERLTAFIRNTWDTAQAMRRTSREMTASYAIERISLSEEKVYSSLIAEAGIEVADFRPSLVDPASREHDAARAALQSFRLIGKKIRFEDICDLNLLIGEHDDYPQKYGHIRQTGVCIRTRKGKIVHYGPPPDVAHDMCAEFMTWWNETKMTGVLKGALAHLYLSTIHPFGDGNGRTCRLLLDMSLAEATPLRCYSLSEAVRQREGDYYEALKNTNRPEYVKEFVEYIAERRLDAVHHAFRQQARQRAFQLWRRENNVSGMDAVLAQSICRHPERDWSDISMVERMFSSVPFQEIQRALKNCEGLNEHLDEGMKGILALHEVDENMGKTTYRPSYCH